MPSRLLKMKASMPYNLEHRLIQKWGYAVEKRIVGDFIMFKKNYISDKVSSDEGVKRTIRASVGNPVVTVTPTKIVYPDFTNQLSMQQKKTLEKRCDNIVNFFPDPYSVPESVRARLTSVMQSLNLQEARYVLEYMDENFPAVNKGT